MCEAVALRGWSTTATGGLHLAVTGGDCARKREPWRTVCAECLDDVCQGAAETKQLPRGGRVGRRTPPVLHRLSEDVGDDVASGRPRMVVVTTVVFARPRMVVCHSGGHDCLQLSSIKAVGSLGRLSLTVVARWPS
jgi:hypothetical protein